ncbi:hypothetical protein [Rossellomorea marisflavi]|uniref:hypothetical protein n=1 Tax=Rossellomorea marisflavi TaxID=189381 RepID=UPI003FA08D8F
MVAEKLTDNRKSYPSRSSDESREGLRKCEAVPSKKETKHTKKGTMMDVDEHDPVKTEHA